VTFHEIIPKHEVALEYEIKGQATAENSPGTETLDDPSEPECSQASSDIEEENCEQEDDEYDTGLSDCNGESHTSTKPELSPRSMPEPSPSATDLVEITIKTNDGDFTAQIPKN